MKPAQEAVARLPKWAQEYIREVEMEADAARRSMRKIEGEQEETPIWVEYFDCHGEGIGPTTAKKYIAGRTVNFKIRDQAIEVGYDNHGRLVARTDGPRMLLRCEVSNSIELDLEPYR